MGNSIAHCATAGASPSTAGFPPPQSGPGGPGSEDVPTDLKAMPPPHQGVERNPGSYDELHKKCKDLFPLCFDGAKVMINKGLSNHFQVSHTLSLSSISQGYRFGVTYVGTQQYGPQEAYPICLADSDISGNLSATVIHQFAERIRMKFASQIQNNKLAGVQLTGEYRGALSTSSLTLANLDLVNESGILVGSYLRRITPRLDAGVELVYQYGRQIPGRQISVLSYAARYAGENFNACATISPKTGWHLSYHHKQQENLQFGVEWETNLRQAESVASFGYQIDLPKAGAVFRASIDTQWTVGAVLEKKLLPMPFTFAMSGMLNHTKGQSRVGVGLIVG